MMGEDARNPRWMLYDPDRQHFPGIKGALLSDLEAAEAARDSAEADAEVEKKRTDEFRRLWHERGKECDLLLAQRDRLAVALREATDLLAETINGYKIDKAAAWLLANGFFAEDEPPPDSLAAALSVLDRETPDAGR